MFTNDYIMRQIELLSKAVGEVFFKRDTEEHMFPNFSISMSETENLERMLKALVSEGKFCEAEDKLFFYLEEHPEENVLEVAISFYTLLNRKTDEELSEGNFSRDEIVEGLKSIEEIITRSRK